MLVSPDGWAISLLSYGNLVHLPVSAGAGLLLLRVVARNDEMEAVPLPSRFDNATISGPRSHLLVWDRRPKYKAMLHLIRYLISAAACC